MHSLIVFAHPDAESLTGSVAHLIAAQLTVDGSTAEVADLNDEGFDPRFTAADAIAMQGNGTVPGDIRFEQERVERADALILVFPVYWWALPGLLKGWIDRVFSYGWAYGDGPSGPVKGEALVGRGIHLVALAGVSSGTYERHGYATSMRVGIDHGIFEYCETTVTSWHFLYGTLDSRDLPVPGLVSGVVTEVTGAQEVRVGLAAAPDSPARHETASHRH